MGIHPQAITGKKGKGIMPEDLPRAVIVLIWLLSGTIIFGALLMKSTTLNAMIFAVVFFGLPALVNASMKKKQD